MLAMCTIEADAVRPRAGPEQNGPALSGFRTAPSRPARHADARTDPGRGRPGTRV
ncbi:hypothetical protein SAMN05216251_103346 [Actinacidiphila alni]|uniref:Uncharacterized protein n=1 Tax=Actinacidiphila alni TaxID=380248 RepID=A0A1I2B4A9_9ACTN|nr:hypothetical protein SAMN05216251_103346 [Actinacidiphila alni]